MIINPSLLLLVLINLFPLLLVKGRNSSSIWEYICKLAGTSSPTIGGISNYSDNKCIQSLAHGPMSIPDCNCNSKSVDKVVSQYLLPLMRNITTRLIITFLLVLLIEC